MNKWYTASTGNHQGLIIEEESGRNIAVAYDKKDAPLIAAAPELLEALAQLLDRLEYHGSIDLIREEGPIEDARNAVNKAKGEE